MSEPSWDIIGTDAHGPVKTHGADRCAGSTCVVHNPSGHHMRDWPLSFNFRMGALAFRECPCGKLHPDPDSLDYIGIRFGLLTALALSQHGCCPAACCQTP